jgi:hypothetical protein
MSAAVEYHVDRAELVAHDYHRAFADMAADKIPGLRNLGLERDVIPVRAGKNTRLLQGVDLGIAVDPVRYAAQTLGRPLIGVFRGVLHDCFQLALRISELSV